MKLRELKEKDSPAMLAWMHDPVVTRYMGKDFASMSMKDCLRFIASSRAESKNLHLAIADEDDRYMGTVSLKHIMADDNTAEFAIILCREGMGKGYASFAMQEIIRIGFSRYPLTAIIWNVFLNNLRAIQLYEKLGYHTISLNEVPDNYRFRYPNWKEMRWFIAKP